MLGLHVTDPVDCAFPTGQEHLAELGRMTDRLARQRQSTGAVQNPGTRPDAALLASRVRREMRRRKLRAELLGIGPDIFSMPAWEILLELFLADITGQKNKVSRVGLDAGIPQSTVQRWLMVLEKLDLIERRRDSMDKRRQWIGLSIKAKQALLQYFDD